MSLQYLLPFAVQAGGNLCVILLCRTVQMCDHFSFTCLRLLLMWVYWYTIASMGHSHRSVCSL